MQYTDLTRRERQASVPTGAVPYVDARGELVVDTTKLAYDGSAFSINGVPIAGGGVLTGLNGRAGFNDAGYFEVVAGGASLANDGLIDGAGSALTVHMVDASSLWQISMWNDADGKDNAVMLIAGGVYPNNLLYLYYGDGAGGAVANSIAIGPQSIYFATQDYNSFVNTEWASAEGVNPNFGVAGTPPVVGTYPDAFLELVVNGNGTGAAGTDQLLLQSNIFAWGFRNNDHILGATGTDHFFGVVLNSTPGDITTAYSHTFGVFDDVATPLFLVTPSGVTVKVRSGTPAKFACFDTNGKLCEGASV